MFVLRGGYDTKGLVDGYVYMLLSGAIRAGCIQALAIYLDNVGR
jgi:hypothetical protein